MDWIFDKRGLGDFERKYPASQLYWKKKYSATAKVHL